MENVILSHTRHIASPASGRSPLHVFNDNGDRRLEVLARHYGAIYYHIQTPTNPFEVKQAAGVTFSFYSMMAYVERLLRVADITHAHWVILLEDDVRIVKPINFTSLEFDLCGTDSGPGLPSELMQARENMRLSQHTPSP